MQKDTFPPFILGVNTVCKSLDFKVFEGYIKFSRPRANNKGNGIKFKIIDGTDEKYTILPFIYNTETKEFYNNNAQHLSIDDFCWSVYGNSDEYDTFIEKREIKDEKEEKLFRYIMGEVIINRPSRIFCRLKRLGNNYIKGGEQNIIEGLPYDFREEVKMACTLKSDGTRFYKNFFIAKIKPEDCGLPSYQPKGKSKREFEFSPPYGHSLPHPSIAPRETIGAYLRLIRITTF